MKISAGKALAAIILAVITAWAALNLSYNVRLAAGLAVGIPSFILLLVSRVHIGKYFSVLPAAKGLATRGIYSKIRHPLYIFLDLVLLGVVLITGLWWLVIIWGVLVTLHLIYMEKEEAVLASAFGDKYTEYKNGTWF